MISKSGGSGIGDGHISAPINGYVTNALLRRSAAGGGELRLLWSCRG